MAACIAVISMMSGCNNAENKKEPEKPKIAKSAPTNPDYRMPARMDSLRHLLPQRMKEIFNDSNYLQLAHAEYMGITPIETAEEISSVDKPIVKITDNKSHIIESLTHSVPYLVPEAAKLLDDIGNSFRDTLARRHLPAARVRVTSLLRPSAAVKKLVRVNKNAVQRSTHQYATTFDIGYSAFVLDSNGATISDPRYRIALAEAIYDLRADNRCMVKYEVKSPCFHITVIR